MSNLNYKADLWYQSQKDELTLYSAKIGYKAGYKDALADNKELSPEETLLVYKALSALSKDYPYYKSKKLLELMNRFKV